MLLSYTSIIITHNNLIHKFYKMVIHLLTYTLHITYTLDTRDPIGSKNTVEVSSRLLVVVDYIVRLTKTPDLPKLSTDC